MNGLFASAGLPATGRTATFDDRLLAAKSGRLLKVPTADVGLPFIR